MARAIYRKYRPATFDELLGQDLISGLLREAARQDRIAHAYLFAGPRGTGKTTTSRIIAKLANCEKRAADQKFREKGEPCNECRSCMEIDGGRNIDVVEIDAASNRGIDEIRDLRENVRVSPVSSRRKVFIIDEAHQLTKDASNALLKTLEEPPEYAIFILATTEAEKLPPTIVSRTQQFHFKRAPAALIAQKLERIAKAESVKADREALDLIATTAEGSFRDAESLFDQLIAAGDRTITTDEVERAVGAVGFGKLSAFAGMILGNDLKGTLERLADINDGGYNLAEFTKDVIEYLRRVMVLTYHPGMEAEFKQALSEDHVAALVAHAKLFAGEKHVTTLKNLLTAYEQMRYSQFPIIPLEVALVESLKDGK